MRTSFDAHSPEPCRRIRSAKLTNHSTYLLRTLAQNFSSRWNFLKFLLQSDNGLLVSEIQKKLGVTSFVSEIKCVEFNYPDFEKLAYVIQHGLRGFIVKNTKG